MVLIEKVQEKYARYTAEEEEEVYRLNQQAIKNSGDSDDSSEGFEESIVGENFLSRLIRL